MAKKIPAYISYLLSLIVILLMWAGISFFMKAPLILPGPVLVFKTLGNLVITRIFWKNFLFTFTRVILSFFITVILGCILGLLCGLYNFARDFFEIPLSIIRSTPVVAVILVAYFWFNSNMVPVFVAVLMALPIMVTSITTGILKTDSQLLHFAKVYELSEKEQIKYIKIPHCKPYFVNGCISCFGLCWKVVAAGEVLNLPKFGVGTLLQKSQVHLETSQVMAQTIVLVFVSFTIEKIFASVLNKRMNKNK